ncbi:uncharacterized protein LOC117334846 [Pecten maximus]|uniref:uncharacterized protein LOC117334846 n=1 Tax=Pecten maximus TaxID=6579 RepID=UPI0014583058|nr:uncharacterized protein LOC117334846 [Pecten maximus]
MDITNGKPVSQKPLFRVKRKSEPYGIVSWVKLAKRKSESMEKIFPNMMAASLKLAGIYLAAHKYFEVDRRYTFSTTKYEDRKFYKHFPIPRLKKLHPVVEKACNKGEFECITEIATVANMSGSLAKFHKHYKKDALLPEYPFSSALEQFQYRTTASYYMCWFTDRRRKLLAYEGGHCLENLKKTHEANGNIIHDIRSIYVANAKRANYVSPFTCAYIWFCPDPCYGKNDSGNFKDFRSGVADLLNPCSRLKDKACFWETGKNTVFDYLQRNRINYTCNCKNERKGFIWSPKYSICIDQDECYDGVANCSSDKICRNDVGSYTCQCRMGFKLNRTTGQCDRHDLFRPTSHIGMKRRNKQNQEDQTGIWAAIDRLYIVYESSSTKPSDT